MGWQRTGRTRARAACAGDGEQGKGVAELPLRVSCSSLLRVPTQSHTNPPPRAPGEAMLRHHPWAAEGEPWPGSKEGKGEIIFDGEKNLKITLGHSRDGYTTSENHRCFLPPHEYVQSSPGAGVIGFPAPSTPLWGA